jgi:peptide/nickel transport system permease protein
MFAYTLRRLLLIIPTVIGVTVIVFFLSHVSGDPVRLLLGPNAPKEKIEEKRVELGLDQPVYIQYWKWLTRAARGDLGESIHLLDSVQHLIAMRIGPTLELTLSALFITMLLAIPIGVFSATRPYTMLDNAARFFAMFWVSMPYFWLGLMLMMLLGLHWGILPISGRGGALWTLDGLRHAILPILTLGLPPIALFTRLTRSTMLEVINEDYIRTARSKGIRENLVIFRHGLRNALIPIVTLLGLRLPWLIGGAVITETVFSWPGMGRLLVEAVTQRDYPVVQGIVLVIAVLTILSNLIVDLTYALIDPRIRYD